MLIGKADQFLGFGCLEVRILPCGLIKIKWDEQRTARSGLGYTSPRV